MTIIINCEALMALPAGTVYTEVDEGGTGFLCIKRETTESGWSLDRFQPLALLEWWSGLSADENGPEAQEQMNRYQGTKYSKGEYIAYSPADVRILIDRLQACEAGAYLERFNAVTRS